MSKSKYRAMGFCCAPALIENTQDYKRSMALIHKSGKSDHSLDLEEGEYKLAQLWKVIRPDDVVAYVLAENVESAIGQACCGVGGFEEEREFEKRCFAVRVPLRIQGWGSEEL